MLDVVQCKTKIGTFAELFWKLRDFFKNKLSKFLNFSSEVSNRRRPQTIPESKLKEFRRFSPEMTVVAMHFSMYNASCIIEKKQVIWVVAKPNF